MKEVMITMVLFLAGIFSQAQTFEEQTKQIAYRIDSITTTERANLKSAVENVDKQLENGEITAEQAKTERERLADFYAERIENQVSAEKTRLDALVTKRVENQVYQVKSDSIKDDDHIVINIKRPKYKKGEKRTTKQFVFAFGLNTLNGEDGTFPDEIKVWKSKFWEFGHTWNTRLSNESNIAHVKYGLSLVYNNLHPEDNQVFTKDGDQTILTPTDIDFKRNRFRNFYLNVPLHLELDFSPTKVNDEGKKIFRSHKDFRVGLGGYAGVLINSKNFFKYKEDGKKVKYTEKDDFNVHNFTYGLSGYIGYKQFSLYSKYDLQPLFENNPTDERNFSIGVRWDFN